MIKSDLSGRTTVVVGASRGLGRGIARAFAEAGAPAVAMFRPASSSRPAYFIRLNWRDDRIAQVRDFRYVPYIAGEAIFTGCSSSPGSAGYPQNKKEK